MTSLHWGAVQISLTNLLIIVGMVMLFVVALLAPLPGGRQNQAMPSTWVVTSGG